MAITFVEALSGEANNGQNVTLNFSAAQSGDFALVIGGHCNTGANAGVSTAGYTEIVDSVSGVRISINYKFLTSDTSVTCLGSASGSDETAYVCFVFRGVNTTNPIDTTSTTTSAGSGYPNPPSITTTTDNCVVIGCFLLNQNESVFTGPTGYSNLTSPNTASDTNEATVAAAWKTITSAGAENPGQFVTSGTINHTWRAYTVAIRTDIISASVFETTGTGEATFVGNTFADGLLSSSGLATMVAVGAGGSAGALGATGQAAASFTGQGTFDGALSATGTASASLVGNSLATTGALSATGTGAAAFVGTIQGAGTFAATGTITTGFEIRGLFNSRSSMTGLGQVQWVGATSKMESVREDIRSRGAATVNM